MRIKTKHTARLRMGVVAAMAVGLVVVPAGAALADHQFTDVPDSHTFHDEIGWLAGEGISTGWDVAGGKEYRPKQDISREAMAAFLYRYANDEDPTDPAYGGGNCADGKDYTGSGFEDVSDSHAFCIEIAWLSDQGISTGWEREDGTFEYRPKQDISREAMAAFLWRHVTGNAPDAGGACSSDSGFTDVPQEHTFCTEIAWLAGEKISQGWDVEDGKEYRPKQNISREAMAAFLYRVEAPTLQSAVYSDGGSDATDFDNASDEIVLTFDQDMTVSGSEVVTIDGDSYVCGTDLTCSATGVTVTLNAAGSTDIADIVGRDVEDAEFADVTNGNQSVGYPETIS